MKSVRKRAGKTSMGLLQAKEPIQKTKLVVDPAKASLRVKARRKSRKTSRRRTKKRRVRSEKQTRIRGRLSIVAVRKALPARRYTHTGAGSPK